MEVVSFEPSGLEVVHPQHHSPQYQSTSPPQGSLQSPMTQHESSEAMADQYKGYSASTQQEPLPSWHYVEQSIPEEHAMNVNQPSRKSWSRWPFVAAVIAAAVIVGAAIGGGVGSKLSSCEADLRRYQSVSETASFLSSQSTTPTFTESVSTTSSAPALETTAVDGGLITNYVAALPNNVYSLGDNCSDLATTTQTTSSQTKFSVYCNVDFGSGSRTGGDGSNITLSDLICLTSYSMQDCLNACGDYSYRASKSGRDDFCGSVTYSIYMSKLATDNCCLKNSTVTHREGYTNCDGCISAILDV
ncbi:hypothetical protein F5Y18DRAFT_362588 [Xylariaceae sp. FL1019]|nr:hypothetical protein F5Y18DRAFT_362588 [Xylariaceae sp. FL1019]